MVLDILVGRLVYPSKSPSEPLRARHNIFQPHGKEQTSKQISLSGRVSSILFTRSIAHR